MFIVYEATCFDPYRAIIRPSSESSLQMLRICWDPSIYAGFVDLMVSPKAMFLIVDHMALRGAHRVSRGSLKHEGK